MENHEGNHEVCQRCKDEVVTVRLQDGRWVCDDCYAEASGQVLRNGSFEKVKSTSK